MYMYRFGIIGDDLRMRYLYESLRKDGFSARLGAQDSAAAVIAESSVVVLPVNKPDLLRLCEGKTVLGGFTTPPLAPRDTRVLNYLENKVYTIKNALATAEGAIFVAMQSTNDILAGKNVAICGFGNIARVLCQKLVALGCNVTVCARKASCRAQAENMGAQACDFAALPLHSPSIIFNTVPAPVITSSLLCSMSDNTIIIELASAPGGIDLNYANAHGITVVNAQGLPGRYSPRFAGEILKSTVISMLEEG